MENKKKLIYIFLILIAIVLVIIGNILTRKVSIKTTEPEPISTISVDKSKIGDNNFFNINWLIDNINLPKQVVINKKINQEISDELILKVAQSFGFKNELLIDKTDFKIYQTLDRKITLEANKKTRVFQYGQNLLLFPIEKAETVLSVEEIENKLSQLIKLNFGLDYLNLIFNEINYQSVDVSNFVLSNENNASIVEIKATYLIDGYPIYNQYGYPIIVKFTRDGTLVKLNLSWLGKIQKTEIVKNIKNLEEIKKIPSSEFKIISVNGDNNYDIAIKNEIIKNTSITKGSFGLLNLNEYNELIPSVILEGNSTLSTGTVSVILAVPVFK